MYELDRFIYTNWEESKKKNGIFLDCILLPINIHSELQRNRRHAQYRRALQVPFAGIVKLSHLFVIYFFFYNCSSSQTVFSVPYLFFLFFFNLILCDFSKTIAILYAFRFLFRTATYNLGKWLYR